VGRYRPDEHEYRGSIGKGIEQMTHK
jgi:hypothetical protein